MKQETIKEMADSFGYLFVLSRRFECVTDSVLRKDNLTTKQLLTLIVIERGFDDIPSVSQVAELLSTSHQNVKQISRQLERRGFVEIVRDENDKRRWLLRVTPKNREFWDSREQEHAEVMQSLFSSLSEHEIHQLRKILMKLIESTESSYRNASRKRA